MEPMRRLDFLRRMAVLGGAFLMPFTTVPDKASGATFTEAMWDQSIRDNLNFLKEVVYQEFVADVPVTATTAAAANEVVSAGAITFEAVPTLIEFFCPSVQTGASAAIRINLWDDTTDLGRLTELNAAQVFAPVKLERRLTPTAASHTYKIKAYRVAANGTMKAGGGGGGDIYLPGFIRITRIPV